MSAIEKDAPYIALAKGDRYGIKPVMKDNWRAIELPFNLANEDEGRALEQELRALFPEIRAYSQGFWVGTKKKRWYHLERPGSQLRVEPSENSIVIKHYSDKEGLAALDKTLRKTILGKKFMKYLKREHKKSDQEAETILREITPLARV